MLLPDNLFLVRPGQWFLPERNHLVILTDIQPFRW